MENASNTPSLRFRGYTDAWGQERVSDLLVERNTQSPKSNEYPLMAFIAEKGVAPKGERYDRSALVKDEDGKLYKQTELGDFIYSSNNLETGSIGLNKYGKATISPVYSIFYPTGLADSDFIGRLMIRKQFINKMLSTRQGVVYGQWKIHESDFLAISVAVPSLEEQRKIGGLLDKVDSLLSLHQRKLDKLQAIKKSLLQKMFPAEGEDRPQIRFAGYTDAWGQERLGDLGYAQSGIGFPESEQGGKTGIPFYKVSDMNNTGNETIMTNANNYVTQEQILRRKWKPFNDNPAIIFAKVGAALMLNRKRLSTNSFLVDNNTMAYVIDTNKWDYRFVKVIFDNIYLPSLAQVGALPSFNAEDVENLEIDVPRSRKEGEEIGKFFFEIDSLLTLHQRKLEKLQEIKKALLQKMFC